MMMMIMANINIAIIIKILQYHDIYIVFCVSVREGLLEDGGSSE